jgi:hypothetical protein
VKINKIIAPFLLYWHFSLDTLLTHVFVITFLYAGFPATAAFLMSLDALFRVMFSVLISRLTLHISPAKRGKVSAILRALLVIVWFIAVSQLPITNVSIAIIAPFIIFKIILLFDSFISSEFIFGLKEYFRVDLSQSAAAQNILIRASTAVAPALALMIINVTYASSIIFASAILLYILAVIFLKSIFLASPDKGISSQTEHFTFSKLMENPYMRWGFIFQIIGNLAFAGVSFVLLKELKPQGDIFLNEITMLYTAFLFVQMVVLFMGEDIIPINTTSGVAFTMGICAVAVVIAGFSSTDPIRLMACFIIGLTYSLTLSAVQKVVTTRLRGLGFIEYVGWAQMAGRLTSFISTMTLGFALNSGMSASVLLSICGGLGLVSSSVLALALRGKMKNFSAVK